MRVQNADALLLPSDSSSWDCGLDPSNQPRITCVIELVFVRCNRDGDRIKRSKLLFVITPWHGWAVPPVPNIGIIYRVAHLVENLGWVDLNFDYSTVCLILPGLMGVWQKRLGS